jgi:HEPN domain-containing protein
MLDDAEHARWRATADEQLRVARLLTREGVNASAVFHAEQAAQCALKAVLHGLGQPGRGHGLVDLSDRVSAATGLEPDDETVDSVQLLAQSSMPSRYPDALPSGTPAEHYGATHAEAGIVAAGRAMAYAERVWCRLREAAGAEDAAP